MADGPSSQATPSESSASGLADMARCLPLIPVPDGEEQPDELPEGTIECSICLQGCIHPVKLPCSHIFCFLCVKGVANHGKRCALCRSEIPPEFLLRPMLLNTDDVLHTQVFEGKYQWFYEGVRGWWQYDVRASTEIEDRYQKGERVFEMLIAGFLYVVDMENMVQYRRNTPSRRRRIKRDLVDIPDKKGVAGLSCRLRPPKRTGGDGGEQDASVPASAVVGSSGGLTSAAGVPPDAARATDAAPVSSVQMQMQNLMLVDADGRTDRNPQGRRNPRVPGSRLAAGDGTERAVAGVRTSSRAVGVSAGPQPNAGSRSNRVNRQAVDASANSQQNQDSRVNRVSAQSVDLMASRQPNQDTRVNRSDLEGVDGAANSRSSSLSSRGNRVNSQGVDALASSQPNQDSGVNRVNSQGVDGAANSRSSSLSSRGNRVNSYGVDVSASSQPNQGGRVNRVNSEGVDSAANSQPLSLSSRGNRVNSHGVDALANSQPNQGIQGNSRVNSQRVEITTNTQPSVGVGGNLVDNDITANQVNQPAVNTVQNCVNAAADESATLGQVSEIDEARLPGQQGASTAHRRIEGNSLTDRRDHVDGSSDSD